MFHHGVAKTALVEIFLESKKLQTLAYLTSIENER